MLRPVPDSTMRLTALLLAAAAALAAADKPAVAPAYEPAAEETAASPVYAAPAAAAPAPAYSAPAPAAAPAAETYGAPAAAPVAQDSYGSPQAPPVAGEIDIPTLELQTILRQSFTIPEKAPIRAFSWLKAPISVFTFETLIRHYATQCPLRDCENRWIVCSSRLGTAHKKLHISV